MSFIAPRGYAVFTASGNAAAGPAHTNFKLSAEGESLRLYSAALVQLDGVDFGAISKDVTRGRYPDGDASQRDFPGTASRGAENFIDTDGDGLPDAWELAHGLNPLVADAHLDADGDGASNGAEFRANTHPQDISSVLRAEVASSENGFAIRFHAAADRAYTVQFKNGLADSTWQKLRDIPAGEPRMVEVADPATLGARRFYRVITPRTP